MAFQTLPYEIFQLIVSALGPTKQDLAECCVVCTGWLPLFMEQLYLDIVIYGPPNFQRFYACLSISSSTPYSLHRKLLIHTLSIQDGNINQEQFDNLPSLCPKLEQLTIDGRAQWDHPMPSIFHKNDKQEQQQQHKAISTTRTQTTWWPCLKSACILASSITPTVMKNAHLLTRLSLRCMFDGRLSTQLITALKQTPLLKYLSIDEFELSLQQLESIHTACPLLVELRLVHPTLDDTGHYLNISFSPPSSSSHIQNNASGNDILPASMLQQFIVQEATTFDNNNQLLSDWFIYIARKYPRLESFEWWQKSTHGLAIIPQIDISVALYLVSQCRHLTSIRFFNINVDPLFYRSILEQNQQPAPLNQQLPPPVIKEIGMNYSSDLGPFAQQLRSYYLWWNEKESPMDYITRLPTALVNLHLSGRMCDGSFDLNLILDQCPHLEFLHIDFGTLDQLAPEHLYQWEKKQHPLKHLIMEEIKFSVLSGRWLAFRCRRLIELDLLDCILTDGDVDVSHSLEIVDHNNNNNNTTRNNGGDYENNSGQNYGRLIFPFQHFEKVKICGIRFANNPSLRAKSVGIYEMDKQRSEKWYYCSNHATYLSYVPVHSYRYKLPVQAIKVHSITKSLSPSSTQNNTHHSDQHHHRLLIPPTKLNALRQIQRHYGRLGRDAPCAGYITLVCRSINTLYLENMQV